MSNSSRTLSGLLWRFCGASWALLLVAVQQVLDLARGATAAAATQGGGLHRRQELEFDQLEEARRQRHLRLELLRLDLEPVFPAAAALDRSEERRVGKECRS